MATSLEITDIIINYNANILDILTLLFFISPDFIYSMLPISTMITILITFLRLSANNEIIALKSSGININKFFLPISIFCFITMCSSAWLSFYGISLGAKASKKLLTKMSDKNISLIIKQKTFNKKFGNTIIYAEEIDPETKRMQKVFIEDGKDKTNTIIAPEGILLNNKENHSVTLKLFNGYVSTINSSNNSSEYLKFSTYDLNFDLLENNKKNSFLRWIKEKNIEELYNSIQNMPIGSSNYYYYIAYFYKKITVPLSCLLLGLTAMFIALNKHKNKNHFVQIRITLITVILYYILMTLSESVLELNLVPPFLCMLSANIFIAILGGYLFITTER